MYHGDFVFLSLRCFYSPTPFFITSFSISPVFSPFCLSFFHFSPDHLKHILIFSFPIARHVFPVSACKFVVDMLE